MSPKASVGSPPKWRFAFDGYEDVFSEVSATDCSGDPGRTIQSDHDDSDINVIMKRFGVSNQFPIGRAGQPMYGDFSQFGDYQTSLHVVMEAEERFAALDASTRSRFRNDPAVLVEFLEDPENRAEALKLGLLNPEPVPVPPQRVEVVNPVAPPPVAP